MQMELPAHKVRKEWRVQTEQLDLRVIPVQMVRLAHKVRLELQDLKGLPEQLAQQVLME